MRAVQKLQTNIFRNKQVVIPREDNSVLASMTIMGEIISRSNAEATAKFSVLGNLEGSELIERYFPEVAWSIDMGKALTSALYFPDSLASEWNRKANKLQDILLQLHPELS